MTRMASDPDAAAVAPDHAEPLFRLEPVESGSDDDAGAVPGSIPPGELADVMSAFTSVTERLREAHASLQREVGRLQGDLRVANQRLRRSRQFAALGQMAASIAHEIRNPLGAIRLYATMLREDIDDDDPSGDVVRRLETSVRDLDDVVSRVLAFAREPRIRPVETDAATLFDHVRDATRGLRDEATMRLDVLENTDETSARSVLELDAGLVHQALVNLVRNAIEIQEGRGSVRLDAELGTADADRACVRLVVEDDGPGFGDLDPADLFDPLATTRSGGTGLGLALVHRIAEAHGGRVEACPGGAGRGARFVLELPVRAEEAAASDAPSAEVRPCSATTTDAVAA